jgi:hypothetical protein
MSIARSSSGHIGRTTGQRRGRRVGSAGDEAKLAHHVDLEGAEQVSEIGTELPAAAVLRGGQARIVGQDRLRWYLASTCMESATTRGGTLSDRYWESSRRASWAPVRRLT